MLHGQNFLIFVLLRTEAMMIVRSTFEFFNASLVSNISIFLLQVFANDEVADS